jgi:hypothetical protein
MPAPKQDPQSNHLLTFPPRPIPAKVPNDTNKNCGEYAVVKEGEDCSNLLAASDVTMDDL